MYLLITENIYGPFAKFCFSLLAWERQVFILGKASKKLKGKKPFHLCRPKKKLASLLFKTDNTGGGLRGTSIR